MHVLNIESNYSFLDSLYQFLIEKFNNYINISEVTVFLPSRRSVNELKHIFLKNSKQQAKILPTIKSIGDIDYDDILLNCSNLNLISNYTDIFKPISNTKYKILLLREMLNSKKNISIDQAINLSKEFEIFLRNIEENKINLVDLSKVIDDNFAIHWQKTIGFLKDFGIKWEETLLINNITSVSHSIISNLELQTEAVKLNKPKKPIIIAGLSNMIKSVEEFIKALSKYDNVYFIMKGAENILNNNDLNKVNEVHYYYIFKKLFKLMQIKNFENIRYDKYVVVNNENSKTIYNSMLPYDLTYKWSEIKASYLSNIEYCEFLDLQNELDFIGFYILNHINENGLKNIAIITDQNLSYRFEPILKFWNIPYNNTYGYRFLSNIVMQYMFLIINTYNSNYQKDLLLSLLKNDFTYFGYTKSELNKNVNIFEEYILNGKVNKNGMNSYRYNLEYIEDKEIKNIIKAFLDKIENYFSILKEHNLTFCNLLKKHIKLVEDITYDQKNPKKEKIWYTNYGSEIIFDFLSGEVVNDSECFGFIDIKDYVDVLKYICSNKSYNEKYSEYPAVNLISIKETRLINYDLVIITNLNDGYIPESIKPDPWINQIMRKTLGLEAVENEIGRTCYEFIQLLMQNKVLLTRSTKIDGIRTIKSRFLQRIETFLDCSDIKLNQPEYVKKVFDKYYKYSYNKLNDIYKKRPKPKPPLNVRPRELSATNIDLLNINPYDIYVKKILKLKKFNVLKNDNIFSKIGTILHEIFQNYCDNYENNKENLQEYINNILESCIQKYFSDDDISREFYRQKLIDIFNNFIEYDKKSRENNLNISSEISEFYNFEKENFVVSARIDRIEDNGNRDIKIIDYKTGTIPSKKEVMEGKKIQLPVESLIMSKKDYNIESVEYWSVKSDGVKVSNIFDKNKTSEESKNLPENIGELVDCVEKLIKKLIAYFDDENNGYVATNKNSQYSDFVHLSRIDDWL